MVVGCLGVAPSRSKGNGAPTTAVAASRASRGFVCFCHGWSLVSRFDVLLVFFFFFFLFLLLRLLLPSVCPVSACLSSLCQRGSCLSRRSAVYSRKRHDHTSSLVQCISSDCAYAKRLCKSFRCHSCIALCLRLLAVIESVSASLCTVDSAIVIVVEALCPRYTKDSAKRPT